MSAFNEAFNQLKQLLKEYEKHLIIKHDTSENYSLNTTVHPLKPTEEGFFGAVQIKKNYVSFHLFPVYVFLDLLNDISTDLKKRMQGKSCFNFKKPEENLINKCFRKESRDEGSKTSVAQGTILYIHNIGISKLLIYSLVFLDSLWFKDSIYDG